MTTAIKEETFKSGFEKLTPVLSKLRTTVYGMVENGLNSEDIEHLPLQSRVKDIESAWQKTQAKNYQDPFTQITDFVGLRIIVFLESDIEKAQKIVESLFEVDVKKSVDKRIPQRSDVVGYRSLHLICSLGKERGKLPEYAGVSLQKFEVQIRTALQHAWAEIEHKRNYKGKNSLPDELQHRLMVLAGTIELLDREFSQIAQAALEYEQGIIERDNSASHESLSEIAIDAIIGREFKKFELIVPSLRNLNTKPDIVDELADFGVTSVGQFEKLAKSVNLKTISKHYRDFPSVSTVGLLRDLMIANDAEKYFNYAHKNRWQGTSFEDVAYLNEASGRSDLEAVFTKNDIDLFHEGEQ